MRKQKYSVYYRSINAKLTKAERGLFNLLLTRQDESGCVRGVYYRECCEILQISYQGFYDALYGLREKGLLRTQKNDYYDIDVWILDNDFKDGDYADGYINMSRAMYSDTEFLRLSAGAQIIATDAMRFDDTNHTTYRIGVKKLYNKYTELLGVKRRSVKAYLKELRPFFSIGVKNGVCYIEPLSRAVRGLKGNRSETDKETLHRHLVRVECRRNRIKEVPEQIIRETADLFIQYGTEIQKYNEKHPYTRITLSGVIKNNLQTINAKTKNTYKWIRTLRPALVHKLLRNLLGLDRSMQIPIMD